MTQENEQVLNPFASAPVAASPTGASAMAVVQREVAEVQAAMVIAKRFRRDPIEATDRILQECTRPTLAKAATYAYAKGGTDISGASIRLAEVLARNWGNLVAGVTELSRANGASECMAYAWDLETNFRDEKRFVVKHWRDTKRGGYAITDEREIYEAVANQGARRKRACMLAVIPGDVTEAALEQCQKTLAATMEVTPERLKAMLAKFEEYGVTKEQIETRIQRRIEAVTPALLGQLGNIYNSLRDKMSEPLDWFEAPEGDAPEPETKAAAVKDRLRKKQEAPKEPPAAAQAEAEAGAGEADGSEDRPSTEPAGASTGIGEQRGKALLKRAAEVGVELFALLDHVGKTYGLRKVADLTKDQEPEVFEWVGKQAEK